MFRFPSNSGWSGTEDGCSHFQPSTAIASTPIPRLRGEDRMLSEEGKICLRSRSCGEIHDDYFFRVEYVRPFEVKAVCITTLRSVKGMLTSSDRRALPLEFMRAVEHVMISTDRKRRRELRYGHEGFDKPRGSTWALAPNRRSYCTPETRQTHDSLRRTHKLDATFLVLLASLVLVEL